MSNSSKPRKRKPTKKYTQPQMAMNSGGVVVQIKAPKPLSELNKQLMDKLNS
ncbi:hypothetical protein OQ257_00010 [Actinobacillus equuli subsp. equuli]|uniref:Uncharacterized protein n=1 Tax=Actinobacillus equuli subsp. equuli TaxID=202947 RepID=A0A9X4G362_ACTEU|nr:hypothetical protein [Actinobacillus equuli]MDE8033559.1 hypothetical protein [Actinobacillus equuli subsp. equuli]